jgi:hypothetical protein
MSTNIRRGAEHAYPSHLSLDHHEPRLHSRSRLLTSLFSTMIKPNLDSRARIPNSREISSHSGHYGLGSEEDEVQRCQPCDVNPTTMDPDSLWPFLYLDKMRQQRSTDI